jgi:NADPH-dependent 2,4-dienoyl-CoA reductase/sulfur reductase-like enzyme
LFWKRQDIYGSGWPRFPDASQRRQIHPDTRSVEFEDKSSLATDKLVIASATASTRRSPAASSRHRESRCSPRRWWARAALQAKTALLVGAGFIGVEVALLLCELGLPVT